MKNQEFQLHLVKIGTGKLTLFHRPSKDKHIPFFPSFGITRVISLLSEKEAAIAVGEAVKEAGLKWTWLAVPNGNIPRGEVHSLLLNNLPIISQQLDDGESIVIHCSAGIHRTGMVAYGLLRWRGYSQEEALDLIEQMRQQTRNGILSRQITWGNNIVSNTINISSNGYPHEALSNFSAHSFMFDGVPIASMEGFLQSLKFSDIAQQKYICSLTGSRAKNEGKNQKWQETGKLYWQGIEIDRFSPEYQQLLDRAFETLYSDNEKAKKALLASGNLILTHTIGKKEPQQTILTCSEFCDRLTRIRARLITSC